MKVKKLKTIISTHTYTTNIKMKLQVTLENMKEVFANVPDIGEYLVSVTESTSTCTAEIIHLKIIALFIENKFDEDSVNALKIEYNTYLNDSRVDYFLGIIIDDMNKFFE